MGNENRPSSTWWGSFNIKQEQSVKWCIGPLTLIVRCIGNEWLVAYERADDLDDNEPNWSVSDTDMPPEDLENTSRYILRDLSGLLTIIPLLADRSVISQPHMPFNLTSGGEVTLFVSSPLWMEFAVGDLQKRLGEIAIQQSKDTWFGPSTRVGELCYASTSLCRQNLDELPKRPHRAITPILIRNQSDSILSVERLNVPAPQLPLYAASEGQLWTPKVTMTREKDNELVALKIEKDPPQEATGAELISKPRKIASSNVLFRAFNAVFS